MPHAPHPSELSDMELLRAEVLRLQDEVAKLRAKQFLISGGPMMDAGLDTATALQQRRMGRIVMLEHENDILRHRLRVEEAKARTLMVDGARRVGDELFRKTATSSEQQAANGMMAVNIADLMLLICAVPPAPVVVEVEAPPNSDSLYERPQARGND